MEQFSISSSDSIWVQQEAELSLDSLSINQNSADDADMPRSCDLTLNANMHFSNDQNFKALASAHGQNFAASFFHHHQQHHPQNSQLAMNFLTQAQAQCLHQQQQQHIQSANDLQSHESQKQYFSNSNKFKNHIMEKYLRGLDDESNNNNNDDDDESLSNLQENGKKPELSKWLESTANFQPSKNNYNIDFVKAERKKKSSSSNGSSNGLCEKELIAAETLVLLKNFRTTKFYNS